MQPKKRPPVKVDTRQRPRTPPGVVMDDGRVLFMTPAAHAEMTRPATNACLIVETRGAAFEDVSGDVAADEAVSRTADIDTGDDDMTTKDRILARAQALGWPEAIANGTNITTEFAWRTAVETWGNHGPLLAQLDECDAKRAYLAEQEAVRRNAILSSDAGDAFREEANAEAIRLGEEAESPAAIARRTAEALEAIARRP